jgi:hypothetical protein
VRRGYATVAWGNSVRVVGPGLPTKCRINTINNKRVVRNFYKSVYNFVLLVIDVNYNCVTLGLLKQ